MKKIIIIGLTTLLLLAIAGASYYYFLYEPPKKTRPQRDRSNEVVKPTKYSLQNIVLVVPGTSDQVVLSLVSPTATRDYPMGQFTTVGSTTKNGQIVALDFFTTELENGLRAVPIAVTYTGELPEYYVAILNDDGTTKRHTASLPLGPELNIIDVTRSGNDVSVTYEAYGYNQPRIEKPSVTTTAIVDIGNISFKQEGRKPWLETVEVIKQFTGLYNWESTKQSDGNTIVPTKPGVFSLRFEANRITLETDCNTGGAVFTPPAGSSTALTFTEFSKTARFCTSAEEGPYFDMIQAVTNYAENSDGSLQFILKDGGEMLFVKPTTTSAT